MTNERTETHSTLVFGRDLILFEEVELAPEERPSGGSREDVAAWLVGDARGLASAARFVDAFAWRLLAAGLPLLRLTMHCPTLHPQFLGATYTWWRTTGRTQAVAIAHEVADRIPHAENPVHRVSIEGETLRRRLEGDAAQLDFPVLHDLRAKHATDYLGLPIPSVLGSRHYMVTYVTDRPGGFTEGEIDALMAISKPVAIPADMFTQRAIAENVLKAYIGRTTGPRVLAGQIRRGAGEEIKAVIWSSDLRSFTQLSDRLRGDRVIAILNALFDWQASAIEKHGGEILKFIGDGLLAIFPIADDTQAAKAASNAIAAAHEVSAAIRRAATAEGLNDDAPLRIVIALHAGTVVYGNIGSASRLDFTVIGPAVNFVSRVEAVAKSLNLPIVVSDVVARDWDGKLRSLGQHELRGLPGAYELFEPELA